jgi:outer membrane scaffolding protein for murein synthesis (MipA/OmpV family)
MLLPLLAHGQSPDPSLLGAALWRRPAYDGSASMVTQPVPIISYEGYPWFARTMQGVLEGGLRKEVAPKLNLGVQLAYESGRKTSESNLLRSRNAPSIEPGASIGAHVEWNPQLGPMPLSLIARLRQAVDVDHGAQADLRLTVGILEKYGFDAALFGQVTWADARSVRKFYGAPGFDPGGGLLSGGLGVFVLYDLSRDWVVMASIEGHRLYGDAASSPLTERRSNFYAFAGPAYKF